MKQRGNAMGKYTNADDRRQTVSLIVRTVLGIAVTFGLLCWYSGGLPGGVEKFFAPENLMKNILPALIFAAVIFIITRKYFSSVDMWKILLLNFCLGNGLPWLNPMIVFLFSIRSGGVPALLSLDLFIAITANLSLYLKFGKSDNAERSLPASIGVYLLSYLCLLAPIAFWGVFF